MDCQAPSKRQVPARSSARSELWSIKTKLERWRRALIFSFPRSTDDRRSGFFVESLCLKRNDTTSKKICVRGRRGKES